MIVELIGPSGCGKTTLVEQLGRHRHQIGRSLMAISELRQLENERGWVRFRKLDHRAFIKEFGSLFWRCPRMSWSIIALMALQGRPWRTRAAKRTLCTLSFSLHLQKSYPDRFVVLDEGFVQSLWALLIGSRELRGQWFLRQIINAYWLRVRPFGIQLKIDDDLARTRAFSRQSLGRFNQASSADLHHQFDSAVDHHRRLVTLMPKAMIYATIDVECTRSELSASVADLIKTIT